MSDSRTDKSTKTQRMTKARKKKRFLEVLSERRGNIGLAASSLGFGRSTVYSWKSEDPKFAAAIAEIQEARFDEIEDKIATAIDSGDMQTIKWFADRRMKSRGYGQSQEVEHSGSMGVDFKAIPDKEIVDAFTANAQAINSEADQNGTEPAPDE